MKKLIPLVILSLAISHHSFAQIKLVGTGENSVFAINPDGTAPEKWFDFTAPETPGNSLIESNGKLWGTTESGGSYGRGSIFHVDLDGSNLIKVHDFDETNGRTPRGDLIEAGGKLWGTTNTGGADNNGIIFSIDLDGTNFTKVHEFDDTNGKQPGDNLIISNGKLWGMTSSGGTSNRGVIFTLDTDGTNFTKVHDFDNTNGSSPLGHLVESGGKLWGVTFNGGTDSRGIIFSIDTDGTNFTKHHDFTNSDGSNPRGSIMSSGDKLFGLVTNGGIGHGVIYSIDNDGTNFAKIHDFDNTNGKGPYGNLIESAGVLWGMTRNGGAGTRGIIFSIKPDGTEFTNHFDFDNDGTNGWYPQGDLMVSGGKFFGMASSEGIHNEGILFSLDLDGSNFTRLLDFGSQYGRSAPGYLSQNDGKIWGMNQGGGDAKDGLIFTIERDGTGFTKIHDFDENDIDNGGGPHGSLIESNEKLWGMTYEGGVNGDGVIFTIDKSGDNYTKIQDLEFSGGGEPSFPSSSLLESNEKLWGVKSSTGASGDGVIFTIDLDGTNYTEVHDFDDTNGRSPLTTLVESNGKIWGVAESGGTSDYGVIFSINTDGTNFTKVHDFNETNGSYPVGLTAFNDKLYGLTAEGGNLGYGVMFSIDTDGTNFTIAHEFSETDGSYPYGGLVVYENKLWGMTPQGGATEDGVIFTYDPSSTGSEFNIVYEFTGEFARNSSGSLIIVNTDVIDPTFTSATSETVSENTTGPVHTITTDESASYSLGNMNDEDLFTLVNDELSFTNAPDFETPMDSDENNTYAVEIIATDDAGNTNSQTVTITITDAADAPTDIELSSNSIAENNTANAVIGMLSSTDQDAGSSFTYALVSGDGDTDNASFNIDGDELRATDVFDFETKSSYSIRIETNDGNGGTYQEAFTVTITNENESISVTSPIADESREEGFGSFDIDLTNVFSDEDGDVLTYSITSSDASVVTASNSGATLTVTEVGIGTATITVMADDGSGVTTSDRFEVEVTATPLGLDNEVSLQVYPNPTRDFVNIQSDKQVKIQLINLRGQVIRSANGQSLRLDIQNLSSGTYLLKISDGESSTTRRIIKAN